MAVRNCSECIRNSVPPQVCSTSSRWAAIARTSIGGVVVIAGRVHVGHVVCRTHHGHLRVVQCFSIHRVVDVHLTTLGGVDLVQTGHCGNAGRVTLVGIDHGDRIGGGVEHGEAAQVGGGA